jgi:hypothetical protein
MADLQVGAQIPEVRVTPDKLRPPESALGAGVGVMH